MSPILQVQGLSKSFGPIAAVQDLSFDIYPGDIYGFLGQNGAGKSTTMRMMLGLIRPDSGTISVKGQVFNAGHIHLLKYVGAIIERPDMYGYLSGLDNLRIFSRLSGLKPDMERLDNLLELVSLKGREHDKVKTYSLGMKQRLGIAIALVHSPDILLLDEPTNGLDPQGIADMRRLIIHLSREHGKTVIISSHLLHEVEQMANRMLILHQGRKVSEGVVSDLLNPQDTLLQVEIAPNDTVRDLIRQTPQWSRFLQDGEMSALTFKMSPELAPDLLRWLVANDVAVRSLTAQHSLEAYFLSLTHASNHVGLIAY